MTLVLIFGNQLVPVKDEFGVEQCKLYVRVCPGKNHEKIYKFTVLKIILFEQTLVKEAKDIRPKLA